MSGPTGARDGRTRATGSGRTDETVFAVDAAHFLEDMRTLAAIVATRPDVPPAIVRRVKSHRAQLGCPLSVAGLT
jgi:hypothetical protein